jgi:hypothetical protein
MMFGMGMVVSDMGVLRPQLSKGSREPTQLSKNWIIPIVVEPMGFGV